MLRIEKQLPKLSYKNFLVSELNMHVAEENNLRTLQDMLYFEIYCALDLWTIFCLANMFPT